MTNPQLTSFSVVKSQKHVCSGKDVHFYSTQFWKSFPYNQRRKRNKRDPNWKRRSKTITADDTILYIENTKDATRKLLELTNKFGKVEGYQINTQNILHSYILTTKDQKKKLRKLIITSKRIKYLGINLPKEAKHLYSENYKGLISKIYKHLTQIYIYKKQATQSKNGQIYIDISPKRSDRWPKHM